MSGVRTPASGSGLLQQRPFPDGARPTTWTESRIRSWRSDHNVAVYHEGERANRSELVLHEAAARLGIGKTSVVRLINSEVLAAHQVCPGAPYVIPEAALSDQSVIAALGRSPAPGTSNQLPLEFQ